MSAVFLEYAWDMAWCDPCAADPLSHRQLRSLGVFWLEPQPNPQNPARDVFLTRLHLRYDREHFPQDLRFQETGDRTNFQGRYIIRRPWKGESTCSAAEAYRKALRERYATQARTVAELTGWEMDRIRQHMPVAEVGREPDPSWWERLWGG